MEPNDPRACNLACELYSGIHTVNCRPYVPPSEKKIQADREEFKRVSKEMLKAGSEYLKREKL